MEALLGYLSWRLSLMLLGVITLMLAGFFNWRGQGAAYCGEQPDLRAMTAMAANPAVWRMMLLFSIGIAGTLGVYSMLSLFLGWMGDASAFGPAFMLIGAITIMAALLAIGLPRS